MKCKHRIVVFLLAVLTSLLSISIFSDNYIFQSIINSTCSQNARIDILNAGAKSNTVKLVVYEADSAKLESPSWFKRPNGIGKVLHFKMKRRWQHYEVTLQAIGDGTLNIQFKGKDRKVNGRRYPALVDFKNVYVNGKKHIGSRKAVWHDKPCSVNVKVKDGDQIVLKMEARKHIFRLSDFHRFYHTNFRMVLAVFIVSCLIYSFLVSMYVKGRAIGGRRADMLFLVGFFVMLVVPMLHISEEKKSNAENRNLAVYDPIVRNGKFNMNYGNKVDKWFGDRFWGREEIMGAYFSLVLNLNKYPNIGRVVYNPDSNWMFNFGEIDYRKPTEDKISKEIITSINKFNHYVETKGAKLYLLIVPAKADVYRNETRFYRDIKGIRKGELIEKLQKESKYTVVFTYEKLVEFSKRDFVFFKSDTHWTDWGAFAGYQVLMSEIKKEFPAVYIANENDYIISCNNYVRSEWTRNFHEGNSARLLGQYGSNDDFLDVKYSYYDPKNNPNYEIKNRDGKFKFKYYKNNTVRPLRAIICGTSMNENLLQFIPQSFSDVLYLRLNSIQKISRKDEFKIPKLYDKYISEFNPHVFILCLTEANLSELTNLMKD